MKIKVLRNSPQTNMGCFVRSLFSETIHTVSKLQFKIRVNIYLGKNIFEGLK